MVDRIQEAKGIQVITGDEISRGRYSNNVFISHTPEEFCIDWMLNSPNGIHMIARIMVSPAHMKRIVSAMMHNVSKYEDKFGEIKITTPDVQIYQ
jgi:hypothetical protein